MSRPALVRNAWYGLRYAIGARPAGLRVLAHVPASNVRVHVSPGDDVCIDGFPRSANTLTVMAFIERNPDTRIAHHTHVAGQVRGALRFGVPCAVLFRAPTDAVASLMVFAEGRLSARLALRTWIHYYRSVIRVAPAPALCPFDRLINDPLLAARALNRRFGTSFAADPLSSGERAQLIDRIARMHRNRGDREASSTVPHAGKEELNARMRERVRGEPMLGEAERLYERLADLAGETGA